MFLMIFSSFIYLFIIYRSYFFAFGRSDFPSYIRYFHSTALPLFLFFMFALLPAISSPGNKKLDAQKLISILSLIFLFWVFEKPYLSPIIEGNKLSSFRQQIQPMVVELKSKIKDVGKIWIYFPIEENGFMRTMPLKTNSIAVMVMKTDYDLTFGQSHRFRPRDLFCAKWNPK